MRVFPNKQRLRAQMKPRSPSIPKGLNLQASSLQKPCLRRRFLSTAPLRRMMAFRIAAGVQFGESARIAVSKVTGEKPILLG